MRCLRLTIGRKWHRQAQKAKISTDDHVTYILLSQHITICLQYFLDYHTLNTHVTTNQYTPKYPSVFLNKAFNELTNQNGIML